VSCDRRCCVRLCTAGGWLARGKECGGLSARVVLLKGVVDYSERVNWRPKVLQVELGIRWWCCGCWRSQHQQRGVVADAGNAQGGRKQKEAALGDKRRSRIAEFNFGRRANGRPDRGPWLGPSTQTLGMATLCSTGNCLAMVRSDQQNGERLQVQRGILSTTPRRRRTRWAGTLAAGGEPQQTFQRHEGKASARERRQQHLS
jgi:hypothetical protein